MVDLLAKNRPIASRLACHGRVTVVLCRIVRDLGPTNPKVKSERERLICFLDHQAWTWTIERVAEGLFSSQGIGSLTLTKHYTQLEVHPYKSFLQVHEVHGAIRVVREKG
jgi:hypothetical protein